MTSRSGVRLATFARLLAAGILAASLAVLAAPAASAAGAGARAATPDPADLGAVTAIDPATGEARTHVIDPGRPVPAVFGVVNRGDAPVDGLVLHVRVLNDLDLAMRYGNCWYAEWTNQESAWCAFDAELGVDAALAVEAPIVATKADARPEGISSIVYQWWSQEWVDANGGLQAVADRWAGPDTAAERGDGDALTVAPAGEPLSTPVTGSLGFIGVTLTPSSAPTASPEPTSSPTPTVVPSPSGGGGGGLPVTGAGTTTVAGLGMALLLVGGVGYVLARRRRDRFVS
jgi:LPXTG-motif cell wall-anchored protein